MKLIRGGVDLATSVFQVHGVERTEKAVWRRKLTRENWLKALLEKVEPGCETGMESCGGAHHWARRLQAHGFKVRPALLATIERNEVAATTRLAHWYRFALAVPRRSGTHPGVKPSDHRCDGHGIRAVAGGGSGRR